MASALGRARAPSFSAPRAPRYSLLWTLVRSQPTRFAPRCHPRLATSPACSAALLSVHASSIADLHDVSAASISPASFFGFVRCLPGHCLLAVLPGGKRHLGAVLIPPWPSSSQSSFYPLLPFHLCRSPRLWRSLLCVYPCLLPLTRMASVTRWDLLGGIAACRQARPRTCRCRCHGAGGTTRG